MTLQPKSSEPSPTPSIAGEAGNSASPALPSWFPECPWPEDVWPMTKAEYIAFIPDPKDRTAVSGAVMRWAWEIACVDILRALIERGFEVYASTGSVGNAEPQKSVSNSDSGNDEIKEWRVVSSYNSNKKLLENSQGFRFELAPDEDYDLVCDRLNQFALHQNRASQGSGKQ